MTHTTRSGCWCQPDRHVIDIEQALLIQEKFPCINFRKALLTFAEVRSERYKTRSDVMLSVSAFILVGIFGKDTFKGLVGVDLESIKPLFQIATIIGVSVVVFSFFATRQSKADKYVCSVLKLASDADKDNLKKLISLFKREDADTHATD